MSLCPLRGTKTFFVLLLVHFSYKINFSEQTSYDTRGGGKLKQISFLYETEEHLIKKIEQENFKEKNLLVFLFSDEPLEKIKEIIKYIRKLLPEALLAGTSSASVISDGVSVEGRSLISFCQFENVEPRGLIVNSFDKSPKNIALKIQKEIISDDTKMIFLFSDGMEMKSPEILDEISNLMPKIPLAGGKAGSPDYLAEETYVFLNDETTNKGILAVSLNGSYLRVSQLYRLKWKTIGRKMVVTKAQGSVVNSIDGVPVIDIYEKYMGKDFSDNLPESAGLEFPFIINRDGMEIARSLVNKMPDGSFVYHGDIIEGEEVRFGYGHIPLIVDDIEDDCIKASEFQPQGILSFSCVARKSLLGNNIDFELDPFSKIAPMAGFFTFGEFFHQNQKNYLLNITMTLLLLSEEPIKKNKNDYSVCKNLNKRKDRSLSVTKSLIHLVDQVSTELEERNEKLKLLSNTDGLTELYNHRYFIETLDNEIKRALRYNKILSIALFDFDDFKKINDTYGHSKGDYVLAAVANKIKESCRETDIVCRYGGDEIIVIFPETNYETASKISERVSENVEKINFPEKDIKITLSYGVNELDPQKPDQLMKKADDRLYISKSNGKNNIICKD